MDASPAAWLDAVGAKRIFLQDRVVLKLRSLEVFGQAGRPAGQLDAGVAEMIGHANVERIVSVPRLADHDRAAHPRERVRGLVANERIGAGLVDGERGAR
jgi:hypothetical protein